MEKRLHSSIISMLEVLLLLLFVHVSLCDDCSVAYMRNISPMTCCRVANPCRRLRRPLNGLLICSSTRSEDAQLAHDTVCQLFCNRGHVPGRSLDDHPHTPDSFHCDRSGSWQPTEHVPSCVGKSPSS